MNRNVLIASVVVLVFALLIGVLIGLFGGFYIVPLYEIGRAHV